MARTLKEIIESVEKVRFEMKEFIDQETGEVLDGLEEHEMHLDDAEEKLLEKCENVAWYVKELRMKEKSEAAKKKEINEISKHLYSREKSYKRQSDWLKRQLMRALNLLGAKKTRLEYSTVTIVEPNRFSLVIDDSVNLEEIPDHLTKRVIDREAVMKELEEGTQFSWARLERQNPYLLIK